MQWAHVQWPYRSLNHSHYIISKYICALLFPHLVFIIPQRVCGDDWYLTCSIFFFLTSFEQLRCFFFQLLIFKFFFLKPWKIARDVGLNLKLRLFVRKMQLICNLNFSQKIIFQSWWKIRNGSVRIYCCVFGARCEAKIVQGVNYNSRDEFETTANCGESEVTVVYVLRWDNTTVKVSWTASLSQQLQNSSSLCALRRQKRCFSPLELDNNINVLLYTKSLNWNLLLLFKTIFLKLIELCIIIMDKPLSRFLDINS